MIYHNTFISLTNNHSQNTIMETKKHLLFLIESEIRTAGLMSILNNWEIDFDLYLPDHSSLIFDYMGIDAANCTDELYSTYFSLIGKGKTIDLRNDCEGLEQLTLQVYNYLFKYSELCAVLEEKNLSA